MRKKKYKNNEGEEEEIEKKGVTFVWIDIYENVTRLHSVRTYGTSITLFPVYREESLALANNALMLNDNH